MVDTMMKKSGMRNSVLAVAALGAALSLSACGGGNAEETQAKEAISASLLESQDDTFEVSESEADCVGEGMVDKIGVDKLKEYGMVSEDASASEGLDAPMTMSDADGQSAADVMSDCLNIKEAMMTSLSEDMGEGDEAVVTCMDESLDDETLNAFIKTIFTGDQEGAQAALVTEELMSCMLEAELGSTG